MSAAPARIIGFSTNPTRYRITSPTGDSYVRCGADLLLNGLKADLKAEGQCPVCDRSIKFSMRDQLLSDLMPEGTCIHVVEVASAEGMLHIACEDTHLFDREECLNEWLSNYAGRPGITSTPQEYLERLKDRLRKRNL